MGDFFEIEENDINDDQINIMFVDDEPMILEGLKRSLRRYRKKWNMRFVEGGEAALKALSEQSVDVIVSDMRMPGMDGASLLTKVRNFYPSTIRFILSGYAEQEAILRTVGPAHQYLAKPCDPKVLQHAVEKAINLRRFLGSMNLRILVARMQTLPSPTETYQKVIDEMGSDTASAASVAEIISEDISMTAEILKLSNSAYFGISKNITNVKQAVQMLGFETMQALVLKICIFEQFEGEPETLQIINRINKDSMRLARMAKAIAKHEDFHPDNQRNAHCAAMLGNIGELILISDTPVYYQQLKERVAQEKTDLVSEQKKAFECTHATLGGYLMGLWGFSNTIVEAISYHLEPSVSMSEAIDPLTCVHVARHFIAEDPDDTILIPTPLDEKYLDWLGVNQAKLEEWREIAKKVDEDHE